MGRGGARVGEVAFGNETQGAEVDADDDIVAAAADGAGGDLVYARADALSRWR